MHTTDASAREWTVLQTQYEQYEFVALAIKLVAVSLFAVSLLLGLQQELVGLLMLVLWMQDAIFKAFQARLGERLLQLERQLAGGSEAAGQAFQLHTRWLSARKGVAGLLGEYLRSAVRPTVAYPYVVWLVVALFLAAA